MASLLSQEITHGLDTRSPQDGRVIWSSPHRVMVLHDHEQFGLLFSVRPTRFVWSFPTFLFAATLFFGLTWVILHQVMRIGGDAPGTTKTKQPVASRFPILEGSTPTTARRINL